MKAKVLDKKIDHIALEQGYDYIYCQKSPENSRKALVAHWFKDDQGCLFCKWFNE